MENTDNKILNIYGREIIDSRGFPTCEAEITTSKGVVRAMVPSGASTGIYEALELRDKDSRFHGKGVLKAVSNINEIIGPALKGRSVFDQKKIDDYMVKELDGTQSKFGYQKMKLGANSILAVSMGLARGGAQIKGQRLFEYLSHLAGNAKYEKFVMPMPCFNVINGGSHAGNSLAFQEFMILPLDAPTFKEAVRMGSEVFHSLKKIISKKYGSGSTSVGDEGGFAPLGINTNSEVLSLLRAAVASCGYEGKFGFALDVAASEFYCDKTKMYDLDFKNPESTSKVTGAELVEIYVDLVKQFPEIVSIEDAFDQDDFENWTALTAKLGKTVQIVGDDLLVTNPIRIQMAIDKKCCNALLLKVNQIGSLSESIEACNVSQAKGWNVMVSHRSGETEDTFIADLVVGLRTGQIKTGAPSRSERTAKYNQLIRIEDWLGDKAVFPGRDFRNLEKFK